MDRVIVRTRKFMKNKLLNRRQFVVDVIHPNRASVSRSDLKTELAKKYRVKDPRTIILFGFRNAFGGGRSSGFGLIYDDFNDAIRVEPQYRLHRHTDGSGQPLAPSACSADIGAPTRKSRKEKKNRAKKFVGKEKVAILKKK